MYRIWISHLTKMKNKKSKKVRIGFILLFIIGILLINLNLISAAELTGGSGSFSGTTGSFSGGTGGIQTYSDTTGGSSYSGGGSFQGGAYSSFGNPYSSISGAYGIYGASSNPQFNNPGFFEGSNFVSPEVYWPKFNKEDCLQRQDFIMQIAPGGCTPAVVRSDLLEEQNVPVFCKLMSIKVNPLIDVSRIRSLTFRGQYPKGISGISYYPARAALRSQQSLISSPINDNLGYVVIILSRQEKEAEMPEFLGGNITAIVDYDMEGAFGTGNTNFYLSEMSDEEWLRDYKQYGFWNGKGYIRADSIEPNQVSLSVYKDFNSRQSSMTLQKGQTSRDIYLSGFYCSAGMNIRLDSVGAPVDSALLRINEQQMWVSRGDRIMNNKCTVSSLDAYAGGGKITLNCPVRNGKIDLSLASGKADLTVNGIANQYVIGDKVASNGTSGTFLGYVGQDYKGNSFVVLVKEDYSSTFYEFQDKNVYSIVESLMNSERKEITDSKLQEKIKEKIISEYKKKIGSVAGKTLEKTISVEIITKDKLSAGISLGEVLSAKDKVWDLTREDEKLAKEYYDWAIKYYGDLTALYPNEKVLIGSDEESYAARAMYEAAVLSRRFGMNEKALDYYDRLMIEYPNSALATMVTRERDLFLRYGESNSKALVNINGEQYFAELLDFRKPTREDANAVLLINGKEETVGLDEIKIIENKSGADRSIQIKSIDDDSVSISYSREGFNVMDYTGSRASSSGTKTEKISVGQQTDFEGVRIKVLSVALKKQAKIYIEPKVFGPRAESNFSFKIGIEKRNIKLSPQKTKEMMDNLQKTIKQWGEINDKLGKVVTGLKSACFATSAVLTVKNLLSGWSGESMARKDIMTKAGGWNEFCEKEVNAGKYISVTKCLLDNNRKIENDIGIYKTEIEQTNKMIQDIQKGLNIKKTDILDINGQVDAKKVETKFAEQFNAFCRSAKGQIPLYDKDNTNVTIGKGGVCDWDTLTQEQRREIMTLFNTREAISREGGSDVLKGMIDKELGRVTNDAKNYWEYTGALRKQEEEAKKYNLKQRSTSLDGDKITYGDITTITVGDVAHVTYGKYNKGENVIIMFIPFKESFAGAAFNAAPEVAGKEVLIQLERKEGGDYTPSNNGKVVLLDGTSVSEDGRKSVMEYLGFKGATRFRESNAKAYQNKMLNPGKILVKYFERAPYKGLPAEVPFDVDNGWYVELTYVLSGFGKPYDESGRPVNFYICNVGPNGIIEFKKSADDICRYYNGNSDASLDFPGMTTTDSRNLLMRAQQAIAEAAKQYGRKNVVIGRNNFQSGISFGGEEGRCSDFMSPMDCNIMFNVCDPVMCPSSRCDLGGDFRVDNVVQTGVIGSLMLCLPNAREGILMPVCLSGIHAGVEGYISIMNSTVACLNESLTTGRNIGICDEIKSIYLCEFFWKQATPLLNVILPRIVESLYSQGVRGGGEYLTVQNAWDNMKASIDYFRNDYAINSMQAFQARSTEEIGGEICKSFMSVNLPNGKNFFDKLTEPDSPVQYMSWFSEDTFTTATLPPTSHYKVYYHIYSGKDQGAYYVVYLKDLPESNYIYSSQVYVVDRGYIGRGSQIDQAKDFTAVSGYKQVCININNKDECGFGKVSSSYLINSLTDTYAAEQIKTDIKSEKECIAGTPSLISALQPNLQAGAEQILEPQLYNNGIIRVCASENPGKKVLPNGQYDHTNSTYDRWKEVGYCDDPTIKCWLDTSSVKDVIKSKSIEEEAIKKVDLNVLGEVDYWTEAQSMTVASEAENIIERLTIAKGMSQIQIENTISPIVKQLTDLTNLGFNNKYRARGMYLLANLYRKVAENLADESNMGLVQPSTLVIDTPPTYIPVEPAPEPPTNSEIERWKEFYDDSDIFNIKLTVYDSNSRKEEQINIQSLDMKTGKVLLIDGSVKKANIINNRVILEEWSSPSPSDKIWTDEMLKKDIIIKVDYSALFKGNDAYKYDSARKQWLTEDKDFNLNQGYVKGIQQIAGKLARGDKVYIGSSRTPITKTASSSSSELADSIFEMLKK